MPVRKIPLVPGEYYHVYNRGNNKQTVFLNQKDYEKFVKYLYVCNTQKHINFRDDIIDQKIDSFSFERGDPIVSIGAWVLMPNHFHLYLTFSPRPGLGEKVNAVTEFMHKLSTAYVNYLNKKHNRTGSLFEGPFKATHITNDNQARYLFSYIHLNPVKLIDSQWKEGGIKNEKKTLGFLNKYKWSSYLDYKNIERPEGKIIDTNNFLEYFQKGDSFDAEILDGLRYDWED